MKSIKPYKIYKHKVQYYETDQMGIVHHSNYIRWFEEARTDFMEYIGLNYSEMEQQEVYIPVLGVQADYLSMVRFGDAVAIITTIREYNGIKLIVDYQIINVTTKMLHCKGTTKHCFLKTAGKPVFLKKENPEFHELFLKGLEYSNKIKAIRKNHIKKEGK